MNRRAGCLLSALVLLAMAAGLASFVFAPVPPVVPIAAAEVDLTALDRVAPATWSALRGKRIYFGHQSVGSNVVAGLESILASRPEIGLRIASATDPGAFDEPGFIHGPVGRNLDVQSKLDDFAAVVAGPAGERLDMALLKFCYADLKRGGDADALLKAYGATIAELSDARPGVRFLHATIPLTTIQAGPKARVKQLLGRGPGLDNVPRGDYNRAIVDLFGPSRVFDIARTEATLPDGTLVAIDQDGASWPCLATEWASDGGHLNGGGQVVAARELLLLLAKQCETGVGRETDPERASKSPEEAPSGRN